MARRRYRRQQNNEPSLVFIVVILVIGLYAAFQQKQFDLIPFYIGAAVILLVVGVSVYLVDRRRKERLSRSGIHEIDEMSGLDFEKYLQALLQRRGYYNVRLTEGYDLGVDLIANKDGEVWAIQAKRYKSAVGLDAIRQVVAAMNHYKCDRTMVITNSYFTRNAQSIAKSSNCVLIDRSGLIELILKEPAQIDTVNR